MMSTQSFIDRVCERILPLSVADNLPEAFDEWRFTGDTKDHQMPCEVCELCGQEALRYHFEIENEYTNRKLDIGSHCILRFELPVYDEGVKLSAKDTKRYLDKLTQQMRLECCIEALQELAQRESNIILDSALNYYRKNKTLTPKFAFVVFWRLNRYKIDHHPSFFSITLKRSRYVTDLRKMRTSRVHLFWQALSAAQKRRAIELGHASPRISD